MDFVEGILKKYEDWMHVNHITPYPDRTTYYMNTDGIIYFNETCSIYAKINDTFHKLDLDLYQDLVRAYWREQANINNTNKKVYSYNDTISAGTNNAFEFFLKDEKAIDPEEALLKEEEKNIIKKTVERLKPKRREVIEALFFKGMTEMEAAIALNKRRSTVNNLKLQALSDLKDMLTEEYEYL